MEISRTVAVTRTKQKKNEANLNNVRHKASRNFGNKKKEHLKDKINELALNSKKLI
jgi:hypothetical protein